MALLPQFLTLLFTVGTSLALCPPRSEILPCSCRDNPPAFKKVNIQVSCWKVDDVDAVRRALQSLKGIERVSVEFRDSRLGSVPSDLFKGLHVTRAAFFNCFLNGIGKEGRSALEGLEETLEYFSVQNSFSYDNGLKFLNVSNFRALEILESGENHIKELGNKWFAEGPANLKELYIWKNEFTQPGDRAFDMLTKIQLIEIWGNGIETLKRSMFPSPANYLEKIGLAVNKISSLPVDMFSNMPALKTVLLNRNAIQRIPEATWTPVWSRLERLLLQGNPLNCDADIDWMLNKSPPHVLYGWCVSPPEREGMDLNKIIADKQRVLNISAFNRQNKFYK